ncbi:hypothetical protein [Thermococcus sp.]
MVKEIEGNQLGLTLIDPSEPEIKEIFDRYAKREAKGIHRLTEYGIEV